MDGALPFLPEEIITNILQRLPVKSLIRFQCVCRDWKNLIKSPTFIEEHLHHSTRQNPSLLIQQCQRHDPFHLCLIDCKMQFREFESPPLFRSPDCVRIVGSSNGLLCFADRSTRPPTLLLWNPATREVRHVPKTVDHFPADCRFSFAFGFSFGFGFSPFINDYKIVRFAYFDAIYEVQVYSLNRGSWRNIQFDGKGDVCVLSNGVSINGIMFWHASKLNGAAMDFVDTNAIVSFDLVSEVFTVTPSPAALRYSVVEIGGYEDKLAIISHGGKIDSQYFSIYFAVMGSSEERWSPSRKYNIPNSHPSKLHAGTIWRNQIVCIDFAMPTLTGETEGEMENAEPKLGLHMINVTTDERKLFTIPRHGTHLGVDIFNYVESLVLIGNIQH